MAGVYLDGIEIQIMKKHLILLLGALILSSNLMSAQPVGMPPSGPGPTPQFGPGQISQPPDGYILVKVTNSVTKFDLDFPGGTPNDLVKAIEKVTDKSLNTIIPNEYADFKIPAFSVKNVTVDQLFEVLKQESEKGGRYAIDNVDGVGTYPEERNSEYGFSTVGTPNDNSIWYFSWDGEPGPFQRLSAITCKFYQLSPYLDAGYKVDDITTAVDTAWKMLGVTNTPTLSYHKDTKLLIAVGESDKVDLIGDVLKQLSTTPKGKSDDKDLPKSKDQ